MTYLPEEGIHHTDPARIRLAEGRFFLDCYLTACREPEGDHFKMIAYLDATLFMIGSIADICSDRLPGYRQSQLLAFVQAVRNLAVHHSILAVSKQAHLTERPLTRLISTDSDPGKHSDFLLTPHKLTQAFAEASLSRPPAKRGYDAALPFIRVIQATPKAQMRVSTLLIDSLDELERLLDQRQSAGT